MQRLIFDTDLGIDDALALLYLLGSPEARIEAITTVHGNVPVAIATQNVFEILSIAGVRELPPIAAGSAAPLTGSSVHAREVHGDDGLGGWTKNGRVAPQALSAASASELICQLARKHPQEITLLLIGPATNAALAWRHDPEAFRNLKNVVAMSGAVVERGNITAVAEFNAYADPEGLRELIRCGVPLTMVGLDVTRRVCVTRELLERELERRPGKRSQFLRCIVEQGFSFYRNSSGWEGMYLHDPLAAAVALDHTLVQTQTMNIDVETTGELTRGMTIADRRPWMKGGENVEFCTSVDAERFLDRFCERVLQTC